MYMYMYTSTYTECIQVHISTYMYTYNTYTYNRTCLPEFDKLKWYTIGPTNFSLHSSLFGQDGTINYDYIIPKINSLFNMYSPMAHTLTIVELIWPHIKTSDVHIQNIHIDVCTISL